MLNGPKCLPIVSLLVIADHAPAGIDSGGGTSLGGELHNHSSLGGSFATAITQANPIHNHPGLIEVIFPVMPSSISDVNDNDLPDGWEIRYFGRLGVNPGADADLDGSSNLLEYLAGTNPNIASSVFRPQGAHAGGLFHLLVPTVAGRTYQIWGSRDLQSWTLQSSLLGNGTAQSFTFDESTITAGPFVGGSRPSNYFFRVQILLSP